MVVDHNNFPNDPIYSIYQVQLFSIEFFQPKWQSNFLDHLLSLHQEFDQIIAFQFNSLFIIYNQCLKLNSGVLVENDRILVLNYDD